LNEVEIQKPNSNSQVEYHYNFAGDRTARIEGGEQTHYLVAPLGLSEVLMEYDQAGKVTADYTYGLGLVRSQQNGVERFFHTDGVGSTRTLTDSTGGVKDQYNFDGYGRLVGRSGSSANPYLFAGQQRDFTTQLDYLRARYYDPDLGRFISKDAFPGVLSAPITQNPYLYANGNPLSFTDPTGYFSIQELTATIALGSILASFGTAAATVGAQYLSGQPPTSDDLLNAFDQWVAGFAHVVTFGISTRIRETAGTVATRNHGTYSN
jgi:RHS repeat-associated protein